MSSSRESRRAAARARDAKSPRRFLLPIAIGAVVIVAAVGAIALTGGSGNGASSSPPPSASNAASAAASASTGPSASAASAVPSGTAGVPVVTGTSLPKFDAKVTPDPAVGMTIPTVEGTDFTGQPVSIALDGKPKVLLFLAHWCVHCQSEVPLIQAWLNGGGAPEGVELISVATAIDPNYPNYPPDEWLAREGWTVPVIVDPTGSVATAYGLSAFPYFVFVGADGQVTGRLTGELPIADLKTIIASLPR